MRKIKKCIAMLCVISALCGLTMLPTAFATEEAQWVEKTPLPLPIANSASATLGEKIYVLGGNDEIGAVANSTCVYDAVADKWSEAAVMPTNRYGLAAVELGGEIYAIGGRGSGTIMSTMEIYNPSNNTWSQGARMKTPRHQFTATAVDGKIYAMGGVNRIVNGSVLSSMEIYDSSTESWTVGNPMPFPLANNTSVALDGKIYVMGGQEEGIVLCIYDIENSTWETKFSLPIRPLGNTKAVAVGDEIYFMGGMDLTQLFDTVYIYTPANDTWREGPSMSKERIGHTVASINDVIYAIGGSHITSVEGLNLRPDKTTPKLAILLNAGETTQLSVSYDLADNETLSWFSSDSAVASVDKLGRVTAAGPGLCDITAENAVGIFKETVSVRVMPGTADQFRLALHLRPAQNAKLHLTDNPADTVWKSVDSTVATVDATGKVSAVSQGLAILEGTAHNVTYQIYVRVKAI